jgi:hypothetical protein
MNKAHQFTTDYLFYKMVTDFDKYDAMICNKEECEIYFNSTRTLFKVMFDLTSWSLYDMWDKDNKYYDELTHSHKNYIELIFSVYGVLKINKDRIAKESSDGI